MDEWLYRLYRGQTTLLALTLDGVEDSQEHGNYILLTILDEKDTCQFVVGRSENLQIFNNRNNIIIAFRMSLCQCSYRCSSKCLILSIVLFSITFYAFDRLFIMDLVMRKGVYTAYI